MDNIVKMKIADLIPYAGNPRKNDHAVETVAAAIKEFGFRVPILIKSDGSIIDGHLRLKAALHLGMDDVPCLLADDMTDEQVRAFRISVNKVAELATWDEDLLAAELEKLQELNVDLQITGFDKMALDKIMDFNLDNVEGSAGGGDLHLTTCPKCGFQYEK